MGVIAAAAIVIAASVVAPALNAWSASVLLLAPPWVTRELLLERPRKTKILVIAVLLAAFAGAVLALNRVKFRRRSPAIAIAVVVATIALLLNPNVPLHRSRQTPPRRPNVVLITLDTVRADHVSVFGGRDTTPQLAAFARMATRYRSAVAPSNYTLPSHTSMFTGLYGSVHGNDGTPGQRLSPSVATLPETLNDLGYDTIAVVANSAYLQYPFGLERGFRYHDSRWRLDTAYSPRDALLFWRRHAALTPYRHADEIEAEAEDLLREATRTPRPFFLFVNFMDAHDPYAPPVPYQSLFPGRRKGLDVERIIGRLLDEMPHALPTSAERAHLLSQYDGGIAYIDRSLGRLFDALRALSAFDDTLIIVTSDHGEAFGEHGYVKHGNSLYDEELRVPLVVKSPNQQLGAIRDDVVSLNDIYPTVLRAAGIAPPHAYEAIPLQQEPASGRVVLSEMFGDKISRTAFDGRWKSMVDGDGQARVFDIATDPAEQHAITMAVPRDELTALTSLAQTKSLAAPAPPLDDEAIRRLRALGYLH
ncbi:MAG TPA: sulfatase [Thermoanaerobaculia bacterium]|nr:sulfatase [Thermoanaerobaculia bacterium]